MNQPTTRPGFFRTHAHPAGLFDLHWLWTVVLPGLLYPLIILTAAVPALHPAYSFMLKKEGGIEWFGVQFLLMGTAAGLVVMICYRQRLPAKGLVGWYVLVTFSMFVLAGEEMSWGQHLGLWGDDTAEAVLGDLNDQQETNFHNMSNALDQLPTYAVMIATFVGCVLNPLLLRRRGVRMTPSNPGYWFWPTPACFVAAMGVLLITWPRRVRIWVWGELPDDIKVFWRHSELNECYIALLFFIYMASVFSRLRTLPDRVETA